MLKITDIVLTEVKDDDKGEEEINDEGEVIAKAGNQKKTVSAAPVAAAKSRASSAHNSVSMGNMPEEPEDEGVDLDNSDIGLSDKKDRFRRAKQYNDKYELDKFLLYLIFAKRTNRGMRN